MRLKLAIGVFLALNFAATAAWAICDLNGNCYNVTGNPSAGYNVQGSNLNTGSMWNQRIEPNGNQSGFDADGNAWNYDAKSGAYNNFGTGESCYGFGAARTCY